MPNESELGDEPVVLAKPSLFFCSRLLLPVSLPESTGQLQLQYQDEYSKVIYLASL